MTSGPTSDPTNVGFHHLCGMDVWGCKKWVHVCVKVSVVGYIMVPKQSLRHMSVPSYPKGTL